MSGKVVKAFLAIAGLLLLLIGLWPNAGSLYDLTGEEELPGQLRGSVQWMYSAIRPQPRQAEDAQITWQIETPFGMNTFLEQEVLIEVRAQTLKMLGDAGFRYIRQQFPWEDIEIHGKGDFTDRRNDPEGIDAWAKYDNIVQLAEENGIEIIARLDNPPSWTRALTDTIGTHAPPDNFDNYGDFVEEVVSRYKDKIRYFQIWNEPNIYPEWGEQNVDPETFTQLLCAGYDRAKAANPEAVIIAGALSPTVALDGRDLNDLIYLQRLYKSGAGECFDILSAQGYGLWSGPTDQRLRPTVINYPHVLLIRDFMVQYGDEEKPIWISEAGWNNVPEQMDDPYGRVTSDQQARYAVQAYQRAQRDWPWAGVINYWFFKRATDLETDQPSYYFRLLEPDFKQTQAWIDLSDYTRSDSVSSIDGRSSWSYRRDVLRPLLVLSGGAILFFLLLGAMAPKPNVNASREPTDGNEF
jgi:hypothetical protein